MRGESIVRILFGSEALPTCCNPLLQYFSLTDLDCEPLPQDRHPDSWSLYSRPVKRRDMRYHLSSAAPLIPVRVRSPIVQIPTANTTNRTIVRVAANGKDAHLFISFYFYVFIFSFFNSTYRRTNRRGSHAYGEAQLLNFPTTHLFKVQPPRRVQYECEAQPPRLRQRTPQTEPRSEWPPTYTTRSELLSSYIPSQVPVDAEPPPVCSNGMP